MRYSVTPSSSDHFHFVTGRLAERSVREIVETLATQYRFQYSIGVMPISVAALMTTKWLRRHLAPPPETTHLVVPGYLETGCDELEKITKTPVICGPNDCRDIPEIFGLRRSEEPLTQYDIEIIAEINHAPRQSIDHVVATAKRLQSDGADTIDFGCDPASRCLLIRDYIKALVDQGITVSVDTFDAWEASQAVRAGAKLVLSVNSTNCESAKDWGVEVVVIPDQTDDKKSFEKTIEFLDKHNISMRLDPILEPIGTGFSSSLVRYAEVRKQYPEKEMMMGIGNLTELTEVDSAGVNFLLLGICQELGIRSVLTTQVINWARSSVAECNAARRLVHYSIKNGVPPKHLSGDLVMLRDPKLRIFGDEALREMSNAIRDNNYRLHAEQSILHLLSAGLHLQSSDPFELFEQLLQQPQSDNVDPAHAFYLGYEMAKASIAMQLGKQYTQDQALRWGMLSREEESHRLKRTNRHRGKNAEPDTNAGDN